MQLLKPSHCVPCWPCTDTSTAGRGSKFGEALTADRLPLITAAFVQHSWLTALHGHVGSQGCSLAMLVAGARALVDFALHVNATVGHKQVSVPVYVVFTCSTYQYQVVGTLSFEV
jgi:diaminopimelate decarboxylase